MASFSLRRDSLHCLSSTITTFWRPPSSSPAMMKSTRREVCGSWYSMPMAASSGISSSCSTLLISNSECFQALSSEGPTPRPVAARKWRDITSSMSSRSTWCRNWRLSAW